MTKKTESNFYSFPKISSIEWEEKIKSDLNGTSSDELSSFPEDKIKTKPFYHFDDELVANNSFQNQSKRNLQGLGNYWDLCQSIDLSTGNPDEIASLLSHLDKGGVDILEIVLSSNSDLNKFISAYEGNFKSIIVKCSDQNIIANFLKALPTDKNSEILIDLFNQNNDPFIHNEWIDKINAVNKLLINHKRPFHYVINIDSLHSKGIDNLEEGFYILAILNEIIKSQKDINVESRFILRLNTGGDFFLNIAKARAVRKIGNFILESYGISNRIEIEMHTGLWNKSVYDRYNNILRLTSESFSAVCGGVDILSIGNFEDSLHIRNEFSLRNARNISHLLKHESHMDKISDVSAGSYFIENLSRDFAKNIWELFQAYSMCESFEEYRMKTKLDNAIKIKRDLKQDNFALGKIKMIGTNIFPNTLDNLSKENIENRTEDRVSFAFESIRTAIDKIAIKNGEAARPSILLLRMGNSEMRFARSGFAAGFLGCAGFKLVEKNGLQESYPYEAIVICASDEDYLNEASNWLQELKGKFFNRPILLAGNPDNKEQLTASGVDVFIHLRSPLQKTLLEILNKMKIETA